LKIDGQKIRQVLHAKQIKACTFAAQCGLSPSTVSAVLSGYQPVGPKTLAKLKRGLVGCGVCAVEASTLLSVSDNNSEPSSNKWGR